MIKKILHRLFRKKPDDKPIYISYEEGIRVFGHTNWGYQ